MGNFILIKNTDIIVDYYHEDNEIYGSFLVSWILKPGTVFFFGVDSNYLKGGSGRYGQDNAFISLAVSSIIKI